MKVWVFSICVLGLALSLACGGTSGAVAGAGDDPVPQSTGDKYILNGNGCPDSFHYIRAGASYGGCRFEPSIALDVYCNGEHNRYFNRFESGPVWRSDSEPDKRGLQVFWPGGDFACIKERCVDCE